MVVGMTQPDRTAYTPRELAAVTIESFADMVKLGQIPIPTEIDVWIQRDPSSDRPLSARGLLELADSFGKPINVINDKDGKPVQAGMRAAATLNLGIPHGITVRAISADVSDADLANYKVHNQVCMSVVQDVV